MNREDLQLLIRADVGPGIGTGHVTRCLTLGKAWKKLGGHVTFACGEMPGSLMKRMEQEGFGYYEIKNSLCDSADVGETNQILSMLQPDWLLIDGHRFDNEYQSRLQKQGTKITVINDPGFAAYHNADLVVSQEIVSESPVAIRSAQFGERWLLGPQFLLLDEAPLSLKRSAGASRTSAKTARNILVAIGGRDLQNWTLHTLQMLVDSEISELVVDVVIDARNQHLETLREFARHSQAVIRLHRNADRVSLLMAESDLCITGDGSTAFEMARYGIPSLMITLADSQRRVAQLLNQNGACLYAGHLGEIDRERIAATLRNCLQDSQLRSQLSDAGRRLVDGQGAHRIARRMAGELFTLRRATASDAEMLHGWRNDPEVRAVSFNPAPIPISHHRDWLKQKLASNQTVIWIAQDKRGARVGQVRFELAPATKEQGYSPAMISVSISPACRGRGYGTMLIEMACRQAWQQLPICHVTALIKPTNQASIKSFRKAGFQLAVPQLVNGQTAVQMILHSPELGSPHSRFQKSA